MKATIILLSVFILVCLIFGGCTNRDVTHNYPSEKEYYKESDIGTNVIRLTSNTANDYIFYQNPNFFSPDDSKFLFQSQRGDGNYRLYIIDISSGEITLLREDTSFGWRPTWSKDGTEIYVGHEGKIYAINIETLNERIIDVPTEYWITFLDVNPTGDTLVFVEENREAVTTHEILSMVKIDGTDYKQLYILDKQNEFFLDHPFFIDDDNVLFLTRGENRDYRGDFNKPYILNIDNRSLTRLPTCCSHYDIHPDGDKILCASEGYIIDLKGNILKNTSNIKGHGVWSSDGNTFLMTGDPDPVQEDSPYFGKITLMKFNSNEIFNLVSHENTYDSSLGVHIQPNAHFSRDGKNIIYQSDRDGDLDLYLVETSE